MKKTILFILFLFMFFSFGCLTYETAEIRIIFIDNSQNEGIIEVIYSNIESSEKLKSKQKEDFQTLLEYYKDDQFLLDQLSDGIYIKKRELFEKNGKLVGRYSGIFRNLKFDNEALMTKNEEYIIQMENNDEIVSTNGKIVKTEKNVFLSWPKTQKELYWKVKMKIDEPTYSILQMFRDWNTEKN